MTTIRCSTVATPVGGVRLAAVDGVLVALAFGDHWERTTDRVRARFAGADWVDAETDATKVVRAYVDGDLTAFDHVDVDPTGTPFQQEVWAALRTIPAGTTWTYGELAEAVGRPGASRAVGSANGANPISLVIPCHRVIRSGGHLGGYGGGLDRKEWLLRHEGARL